jgi:hypothetical protein
MVASHSHKLNMYMYIYINKEMAWQFYMQSFNYNFEALLS